MFTYVRYCFNENEDKDEDEDEDKDKDEDEDDGRPVFLEICESWILYLIVYKLNVPVARGECSV